MNNSFILPPNTQYILIYQSLICMCLLAVSPEESAHAAGTNMSSASNFFMATYPCNPYTQDNYLDLFWTGCSEIPGKG